MQVDVIRGGARGDDGIFCVLLAQGVELVRQGLAGDGLFFNPADDAVWGFDLDGAPSLLEDLQLLSVGDLADAVGDGSEAVAQDALLGNDIDVLSLSVRAEATAARGGQQSAECHGG